METKYMCLSNGALCHCTVDYKNNKVFFGNRVMGAVTGGSHLNVIPIFRSVGICDQINREIYDGHLLKIEYKDKLIKDFEINALVMQVVWSPEDLCWMLSNPAHPEIYLARLCDHMKKSLIIGHAACKYPREHDLSKNTFVQEAIEKLMNKEGLNEKSSSNL